MRVVCKLFGHRWHYHFSTLTGPTKYRSCACGRLQQYIDAGFGWYWTDMIEYTRRGAERMLRDLPHPVVVEGEEAKG